MTTPKRERARRKRRRRRRRRRRRDRKMWRSIFINEEGDATRCPSRNECGGGGDGSGSDSDGIGVAGGSRLYSEMVGGGD